MVAAYAAAGVANSEPFETGKTAFLLSLNEILVPFAFAFARECCSSGNGTATAG